jgi:hypothetical protein
MNIYIVGPDSDTHMVWVNNQPQRDDPGDWNSPQIPVPITDGIVGTWTAPLAKAGDFPLTLDFVLTISRDLAVGVAAGLIVEWIMSNFKGRAEKVVIERMEATFDQGVLTKIVTETITSTRGA